MSFWGRKLRSGILTSTKNSTHYRYGKMHPVNNLALFYTISSPALFQDLLSGYAEDSVSQHKVSGVRYLCSYSRELCYQEWARARAREMAGIHWWCDWVWYEPDMFQRAWGPKWKTSCVLINHRFRTGVLGPDKLPAEGTLDYSLDILEL